MGVQGSGRPLQHGASLIVRRVGDGDAFGMLLAAVSIRGRMRRGGECVG